MNETNTPHTFEDGFVNPPLPRLKDGQVDLNEFARESRDGERRLVMTLGEALDQPGGYHNVHMVNPELHPVSSEDVVDLKALQGAFKAARAAEAEEETSAEN